MGIWWHLVAIMGIYVLGVATSKNIRRFLVKLRNDPRGAVDAEIASLRKFKDGLTSR